jgi:formate C-acetyltransferase
VDTERAVIITESYRENEGRPEVLRRALGFNSILSRMSIDLRDDELIVGNQTKNRRGVPLFPEYAVDWIRDQMDDFMTRKGDRFFITEEQKKTLRGIIPYWEGRCLRDRILGAVPASLKEILVHGVFVNENYTMSGPGHISPRYKYLIENGLSSVIDRCRNKRDSLDMVRPDYSETSNLYLACETTCRALVLFAGRYADAAEAKARETEDPVRKRELLKIAEVCRKVPAGPASTFHEALQFIYFVQLALQIEANGLAICLGRLDQTLIDYYRGDIASGRISRGEALELLECFYLKISEIDKIYSNQATRFLQGPGHGQCITVGGVDRQGRDATNELSYLMLEADRDVRLVQPDIAVRIHRQSPEDFLREATVNVKSGINKIKVFNDEVITESMLDLDMPLEDARDFSFLGCSEPVIEGKTDSWGNSGHLNLAKCLELALNDGACMLTGTRMGPRTGKAEDFTRFGDLLEAFKNQVRYFIRGLVAYDNIIDVHQGSDAPLPLYSLAVEGCLERGIEFNKGGAIYNTTSPLGVGPITVGDSLAAVKKLVFEDKKLTMEALVDALRSNFEGNEPLRLMLLNRAPKFGNDEDSVDEMCNEVLKTYCDELRLYKNARGGPFIGGLYYLSANIPYGLKTAATPDGRKSGEPLNDGGISPSHGMDTQGATAVAKSVGKLDNRRVPHGCVLNQRFHPSLFEGEGKVELFSDYMRTFMDLGGWECQFNVVTTEQLKEAQKHPEKHRNMVIRVAGYSAYFTELEKELQDDIINRTEQHAL